jgi:methylphosphotriester-DNA--protein-cysteine methyltransferase
MSGDTVRRAICCPGMEAVEVTGGDERHPMPECAQLALVLSGSHAGSVVFRPPGGTHCIVAEEDSRVLLLVIPCARFAEIDQCLAGALRCPLLLDGQEAGVQRKRIELEWCRSEPSPVLLEAAALALLHRAAEVVRARAAQGAHERRPPRQVALEARLDAAREALLATSRGIADIAASTGFADHAHLTKMFRKAFGTTPSDYRAVYR